MKKIQICCGKTCRKKQSEKGIDLEKIAKEYLQKKKISVISLESCGCTKNCERGPNLKIKEDLKERVKNGIDSEEKIKRVIDDMQKQKGGYAQKSLNSLLSGGF